MTPLVVRINLVPAPGVVACNVVIAATVLAIAVNDTNSPPGFPGRHPTPAKKLVSAHGKCEFRR